MGSFPLFTRARGSFRATHLEFSDLLESKRVRRLSISCCKRSARARNLSGLLLLFCFHLLALAEELVLDGWVYWVAGHGGKFRQSGGMFENGKSFGDREITWERVYPSSRVSSLRFPAHRFPQTAPIVVS